MAQTILCARCVNEDTTQIANALGRALDRISDQSDGSDARGKRPGPNHWWICDDCGLCTCPCCDPYCQCEQFDGQDAARDV